MPRTRRHKLSARDYISALQDLRLQGLETGEYEPLCDRETFYLLLHQRGARPVRDDFILSPPLFRLESFQLRSDKDDNPAPDPAPPFTPSPETAISPG